MLWSLGSRQEDFSSCPTWAQQLGSWAPECRLSRCGSRAVWHVRSSQTEDHVLCIARQILNHWAIKNPLEGVFLRMYIA